MTDGLGMLDGIQYDSPEPDPLLVVREDGRPVKIYLRSEACEKHLGGHNFSIMNPPYLDRLNLPFAPSLRMVCSKCDEVRMLTLRSR